MNNRYSRFSGFVCLALVFAAPVFAGDDVFTDAPDGAKRHIESGFICPDKIGRFDRDAVGERNPAADADYCAYSALDGVYGTITLSPIRGGFDPKALMAHDFVVREGSGGRMSGEETLMLGPDKSLPVYTRTYDASRIASMRYRTQFAASAVANWAVEVSVEYADPRDLQSRSDFLNAVFAAALQQIAGAAPEKPKSDGKR